MLDFTLSFAAVVIIFVITALVLVKLYRHGVKVWMVHTAIVLVGLFYFIFRPFEITREVLHIYLVVAFTSIFVTEKPVSKKSHSESDEPKAEKHSSGSLTDNIADFLLIYAIFDYFDDNDDW